MKKFISFAAMMLLCVLSLSAQNYKGSWISPQSFEKYFGLADEKMVEETGMKAPLIMKISDQDIRTGVYITLEEDGNGIEMFVIYPGTYTIENNVVKTQYKTDAVEVKLVDLKTNDPETKALMEGGAKSLVLSMLEGQMKEELKPMLKGFEKITTVFSDFTIIADEANADAMTVKLSEELSIPLIRIPQ